MGKFRFEMEIHWVRGTGAHKGFIDKPFQIDYYTAGGLNVGGLLRSDAADEESQLGYLMEILSERNEFSFAYPVLYSSRFTRSDWVISNFAVFIYQDKHRLGAFITSIGKKKVSMVKKGQQLMTYEMISEPVGYEPKQ